MTFTLLPGGAASGPATVPRRPAPSPAWRHADVVLVLTALAASVVGA